jgi:predicted Zn-dependent protease
LVDLSECFDITATHEIGHSLGIFGHTGDPMDMMYADPEVTVLSERDRQTAEVLSHYPANMIPVR